MYFLKLLLWLSRQGTRQTAEDWGAKRIHYHLPHYSSPLTVLWFLSPCPSFRPFLPSLVTSVSLSSNVSPLFSGLVFSSTDCHNSVHRVLPVSLRASSSGFFFLSPSYHSFHFLLSLQLYALLKDIYISFACDLHLLRPHFVFLVALLFVLFFWSNLWLSLCWKCVILFWLVWVFFFFFKLCADAVQKTCWQSFGHARSTKLYSSFPSASSVSLNLSQCLI